MFPQVSAMHLALFDQLQQHNLVIYLIYLVKYCFLLVRFQILLHFSIQRMQMMLLWSNILSGFGLQINYL